MALNDIDLVTIARARLNPALETTTLIANDLLDALITSASQQAINWMGRDIKSQIYTDKYFDGSGDQTMFLAQYPITDIDALSFRNPDATTEAVMASGAVETLYFFREQEESRDTGEIDFVINNPSGFERFPRGFRNIKITYTAGFSPIPLDIQEATIEQVIFLKEQGSAQSNVASEKLGDWAKSFFNPSTKKTFSETALKVFSLYRNMDV